MTRQFTLKRFQR